jgi:hypothetical protein
VIAAEARTLIQRISRDNGLWGAPRIHGELAKLGVRVSRTTVAKYLAHRSGPPALTWCTFLRNHAHALIVSGADAELSQALRALYTQVRHTRCRWLTWCATRWLQRSSRRSAVAVRAPRAPTSVPAVRHLIAFERAGVYERGPPDFQSFPHDDPLRADSPRELEMASVRLASSAVGRWGMHPRIARQGKCHTPGQARGTSRRVTA